MKIKVGDEVRLTIVDHAMMSYPVEGLPVFNVYGKILEENPEYLVIGHWTEVEDNKADENTEVYVIIRSAIKEVRVFE